MTIEHYSERSERALVSLAVHGGDAIADRVLDQVRPDYIVDLRLRRILAAVGEVRAEGASREPVVVSERVRSKAPQDSAGVDVFIDELAADMPAIGAVKAVAKDVIENARWRSRAMLHQKALEECSNCDLDGYAEVQRQLDETDYGRHTGGYLSPHDLASGLIDMLDQADQIRYEWPLDRMNRLTRGGARRGQVTFIGGPSSHGKSAFVDMALHSMAKSGATAVLFLNEMTAVERAERIAARLARVRYSRIQEASAGGQRLSTEETKRVINEMAVQPVAMVACAGWSMYDITREARRRKCDVLAVDLVQKLPFESGRKRHETLESAVQHIDAFAKDTGCHVILVGQINRARAQGTWPIPGMADVKDCAELVNGPDNVLFVWREQNEQTLDPLDTGLIRMAKYRGCRLEAIPVEFQGEFQLFTERHAHSGQVAA